MGKMKYIFLLPFLLPFKILLSQGILPLSGVNKWELRLVSPPPYNVFDTTWTGMEIRPGEIDPGDSIQLFRQYGETHRFPPNLWVLAFEWMRRETTQIQFDVPDKILIDFRVAAWQNLQELDFGVILDDTVGPGAVESTQKAVETLPTWQTLELDVNWSGGLYYINLIRIQFTLLAPDSMRVGLEILLNNMRFVYTNGDTIVIDNFGDDGPNSVEPVPGIPTGFVLHQNYSNPFNPSTEIRYELPKYSSVKLNVYSLLGEEVTELISTEQPPRIYEIDFDGENLPSGTYIFALSINGQRISSRKMLLIK